MERDDVEVFNAAGGSKLPSQITTGYSKGAHVDAIFREMDREDILREVSKHPVCERKSLLKRLYAQKRRSYTD